MSVVVETTKGTFTIDLYVEERPKACRNFLKLCKIKFYNFCLFHNIQANFIAQTGDPTGTGRGGESVYKRLYGDQARFFQGDAAPKIKHKKFGAVAMVNCGDEMFGSQFFVTLGEDLDSLDAEQHCVFGEVAEGWETVEMLNEAICDGEHRPYQDIRITHTVVIEDPFEDPEGLERPDASPLPGPEMLATTRIAADEELDPYGGKTAEEIAEIEAEKAAKARATILEMVGDLPEADVAPPENVLFVCKLNPVTSDDDLEIIFSRFGRVKSCEVIRDRKSGDSLQYAFVEFDEQKSCEAAYFKMDNVLIDDRRIHVDFSQSVSQYRWKGKGRLEIKGEKSSADRRGHDAAAVAERGQQQRPRDAPNGRQRAPPPPHDRRADDGGRDDRRRRDGSRDRGDRNRGDRSPRDGSSERRRRRDRSSDRRHRGGSAERRRDGRSRDRSRDGSRHERRDRNDVERRDPERLDTSRNDDHGHQAQKSTDKRPSTKYELPRQASSEEKDDKRGREKKKSKKSKKSKKKKKKHSSDSSDSADSSD